MKGLRVGYMEQQYAVTPGATVFEELKRVFEPVFEMEDVVFVEVSEIKEFDPELRTFANINTVDEMQRFIELSSKKEKS